MILRDDPQQVHELIPASLPLAVTWRRSSCAPRPVDRSTLGGGRPNRLELPIDLRSNEIRALSRLADLNCTLEREMPEGSEFLESVLVHRSVAITRALIFIFTIFIAATLVLRIAREIANQVSSVNTGSILLCITVIYYCRLSKLFRLAVSFSCDTAQSSRVRHHTLAGIYYSHSRLLSLLPEGFLYRSSQEVCLESVRHKIYGGN